MIHDLFRHSMNTWIGLDFGVPVLIDSVWGLTFWGGKRYYE